MHGDTSHARYARQTRLPMIGDAGQRRLAASRVVIVGCGALGCATADLLCRAGVGAITIIDRDIVELTNLQRQVLFTEADAAAGVPKAEAAQRRLNAVNSHVRVTAVVADVHHRNVVELTGIGGPESPHVIVDGTDNFGTRYLLNDVAIRFATPFVYAGVVATHAMQMSVIPGRGPCLRCVFPQPPEPGSQPTCDTAGVLGPAVTLIASLQATEVLRVLLSRGGTDPRAAGEIAARSVLREIDVWEMRWREIDLSRARQLDCPACGERRFEFLESSDAPATVALCGQNAVQVAAPAMRPDLGVLAKRLQSAGVVAAGPFMLRLTPASGLRLTVFADGRAIVHGTADPGIAKAFYDRLIGS
ncbi:MAG: ThiF family adenylyltransferase [Planctomycetota bacterium]|nr:ThiF family adenylyltransferase [Planctomycetota bacterium]